MLIYDDISPEMERYFKKNYGVVPTTSLIEVLKSSSVSDVKITQEDDFWTDARGIEHRSKSGGIVKLRMTLNTGESASVHILATTMDSWDEFISDSTNQRWIKNIEEVIGKLLKHVEFIPSLHIFSKSIGDRPSFAMAVAEVLREKLLGTSSVYRWDTNNKAYSYMPEKEPSEVFAEISANLQKYNKRKEAKKQNKKWNGIKTIPKK